MSHLVFVLVLGFIVWQWLAKRLRSAKAARPDAGRSSSPRSATADDVQFDEIAEVAAAVVSGFLGKKGEDMLEQAVGRAMRDSKAGTGIGRRPTDAVERASKKAAAQAPAKRRTKYLLDGDGGFRQRTDRTARLQQSFRGKGLCSPR